MRRVKNPSRSNNRRRESIHPTSIQFMRGCTFIALSCLLAGALIAPVGAATVITPIEIDLEIDAVGHSQSRPSGTEMDLVQDRIVDLDATGTASPQYGTPPQPFTADLDSARAISYTIEAEPGKRLKIDSQGTPIRLQWFLTFFRTTAGSIPQDPLAVTLSFGGAAGPLPQFPDLGQDGLSQLTTEGESVLFGALSSDFVTNSGGVEGVFTFTSATITLFYDPLVSNNGPQDYNLIDGSGVFGSYEIASTDPQPRFIFLETLPGGNLPPTARTDIVSIAEDPAAPVVIDVLGNDFDPAPAGTLTVQSVSDPPNGTAVLNGGAVTYQPDLDFAGTDVFSYTLSDGQGGQATGYVMVEVTPVNDPPKLVGEPHRHVRPTDATTNVPLRLFFEDPDANHSDSDITFQYISSSNPAIISGSPSIIAANGFLLMTLQGNAGTTIVTIEASDPLGASSQGEFPVTVYPGSFADYQNLYLSISGETGEQGNPERDPHNNFAEYVLLLQSNKIDGLESLGRYDSATQTFIHPWPNAGYVGGDVALPAYEISYDDPANNRVALQDWYVLQPGDYTTGFETDPAKPDTRRLYHIQLTDQAPATGPVLYWKLIIHGN